MTKWIKRILFATIVMVFALYWTDWWVTYATRSQHSSDITAMPERKVGLVLGTSKFTSNGSRNLYYRYRLEAARELIDLCKVDYLLISGDNATMSYNEPMTMLKDLVAMGIPKDKIFLDYAGFRTLDSVIRALKVFGQQALIVVSQDFQNERAIYIAGSYGMDVYGYDAQDVLREQTSLLTLREKMARVKMLVDLVTQTSPKYLGDPVLIP